MTRARVFGASVLCACGLFALALVLVVGRRGPAPSDSPSAEPRSDAAARAAELAAPGENTRSSATPPASAATAETPLAEDELAALLRAAAVAYAASDRAALESALTSVLGPRAGALRVVRWSRETRSDAQAVAGALLAFEAALQLAASAANVDIADELVRALLAALPELEPAVCARVVAVLSAARGPHGNVFGVRHLRDLLALRSAHPELASQLGPLFERAGEGLAGDETRADFRRLFLTGSDDPALVKLALGSLLAVEPATFLPLAEELYARAKDQRELRSAIAQAIAASAPVADAAAILARCAGDNPYGQLQTLGSRPGALDAIAHEYDALLASGANARGRQLLVSGMRGETENVLLGIARLDPEPGVRLQALLTLTIRGPASADVVRELGSLHASGELSGGLATKSAVLVAENVLLRSPGAARDAARDFLGAIVRDPGAVATDRLDAYTRLRAWVPPGTFRGVVVDGRVLE